MKKALVALTFSGILLVLASPSVAEEGEAARELERGFFKEQAERDLEGAIRIYARLLSRHRAEKEIAARALVRMGICLEKLGRTDEAEGAFRRVLAEFETQSVEVAQARKALRRIAEAKEKATVPKEGAAEKDETPGPAERIRKALEEEKVSVDFIDASIGEVFDYLRTIKSMNIVVDPKVLAEFEREGRTVNLKLDELNFGDTLGIITRFSGLEHAILHHVLYVASPTDLQAYRSLSWCGDPAGSTPEPDIQGKKMTFNFSDMSLRDALASMKRHWNLTLAVSAGAEKHLGESVGILRGTSMPPATAVEQLLRPFGLGYAVRSTGVWIATKKELRDWRERERRVMEVSDSPADRVLLSVLRSKTVSVDFLDTPLEAVLGFLRDVAGINLLLGPSVTRGEGSSGIMVGLNVNEIPLEQVLRLILMPHGIEYRIEHGVLTVEKRGADVRVEEKTPMDLLREALEETVDVDFREMPIEVFVDFLSRRTGVTIFLDERVRAKMKKGEGLVTLRARGLTVKKALETVTKAHTLDFDILHGAIYINWPGYLRHDLTRTWFGDRPSLHVSGPDLKVLKKLRCGKTTVALLESGVMLALDTLARIEGFEIVLTPRAKETLKGKRVTLRASQFSIENTIRLILTTHDLDYRIENGVVTIDLREE